ncbi:hypothetical protein Tco_0633815 [Tanacetum coccineum]
MSSYPSTPLIPSSTWEVPSFDKPEPQPQPLPSFPSLDESLGEERGHDPQTKPHSPDSLRMKMIEDDWELESKVSFLGRELNLRIRPKEVEKIIFDKEKPGSS